jgi:transposase
LAPGDVASHKKKARALKASLALIDESGFLMAPLVRRTWAPRGHTPSLYHRTRSHQKVSAIAAIVVSPKGRRVRLIFRLHKDTNINAKLALEYLGLLKHHIAGRCIVVWDRSRTHKAKIVQTTIASQSKLLLEYFPPYAPELNPVEYVWGYLKNTGMANNAPTEVDVLARETRRYTRAIQMKPVLLRAFLHRSSLF